MSLASTVLLVTVVLGTTPAFAATESGVPTSAGFHAPPVELPDQADLAASAAVSASESQQRLMDDVSSAFAPIRIAPHESTPWASRGQLALFWAMAQIGKPYGWGATGPNAFDCSGLSSRAWHAAGVDIPRTSQEQWGELPRVTDGILRVGDLVIYNADASHVAVYAGGGRVVHAPRPGRVVGVADMYSMRVLGVVRPR